MASAAGEDPLLPWLRSIRQLKQSCHNDKSNMFPCVAECFRLFRDDERYRNDIRFLKICIQYADCSPDPLAVVAELDEKGIGRDYALFYEAYATCLEAKRRFGDANNVYKRGLSRQAQPCEKLASSYKLFRDRMDARKKRKQEQVDNKNPPQEKGEENKREDQIGNEKLARVGEEGGTRMVDEDQEVIRKVTSSSEEAEDTSFEEMRLTYILQQQQQHSPNNNNNNNPRSRHKMELEYNDPSFVLTRQIPSSSFGEETIQIRNFAAKAITGKEKDVEDVQHHGLVDPTVNTKEAIQYILSMFREPMDLGNKKKSSEKQSLLFSASPPPAASKWMNQPLDFSVFSDSESQDPVKAGGQEQQESGFFVFKDDEAEEQEIESSVSERSRGRSKLLSEKNVNEDCALLVFRDEGPHDAAGDAKKSHEKKLFPAGGGVENAVPMRRI